MMSNHSSATKFCLIGFPGSKELHDILFATFFLFYSVTLMGNMVIIVIVCVDKRLQSPMYFFLGHFSAAEILTTSIIIPVMLQGLLLPGMQTISLARCVAQLFLNLAVGTTEFVLMGVMAVDRYVAVCNPLRYNIIMDSHTCIWVVITSWVFGFLFQICPVYAMFQLTFCQSNVLGHFYCDRGQLLKLSCDDSLFTELILFLMAIFIIIGSLAPVIVSYTYIISTILKIPLPLAEGKPSLHVPPNLHVSFFPPPPNCTMSQGSDLLLTMHSDFSSPPLSTFPFLSCYSSDAMFQTASLNALVIFSQMNLRRVKTSCS